MNWLEAFGRRVRSPADEPVPEGLPAGRMAVYEQLFFNTHASLLAKGFPVLKALLGDDRWDRLIRLWLQTHDSHEPLFPDIGEEFVAWMAGYPGPSDWPEPPDLLAELAHYERVETSLYLHEDPADWAGWSPLAWPLAYRWRVHELAPGRLPSAPPAQPLLVLAWRDASGKVHVDECSPPAWQLAMALQQGEPLAAALERLAPDAGRDSARSLLQQWQTQDLWRG
jgi:hypothetical protein